MWDRLKEAAQFLGVVGTGGGGFTVLAFGIGYLATKAHDAMLGLPTTGSSYGVYVRTGALFFPRSIHDVALGAAALIDLPTIVGIVLIIALVGFWKRAGTYLSGATTHLSLFMLAYSVVVVLVLLYLPYHVEPLHPRNTGLLFQAPARSGAGSEARPLPVLTVALRRDDVDALHRRYGAQVAALLAFGYGAFLLTLWRRELSKVVPKPSYWLGLTDWIGRPVLYGSVAAFVITIPTIYGVLAVPQAHCVQPTVAARPEDRVGEKRGHGLLWSDLTDTSQVIILERARYGYVHQFYPRNTVRRLETIRCRLLEPPPALPGGRRPQ